MSSRSYNFGGGSIGNVLVLDKELRFFNCESRKTMMKCEMTCVWYRYSVGWKKRRENGASSDCNVRSVPDGTSELQRVGKNSLRARLNLAALDQMQLLSITLKSVICEELQTSYGEILVEIRAFH